MEPPRPEEFASWGPHSVIRPPVLSVVNPSGIAVGSWVHVGALAVIEALGPPGEVAVTIGDGTYLGNLLRLTAVSSVEVGREVLVSDRVYISDTGHIYEDPTVPIKRQGLRDGRPVRIGDGAWLGVGSVVLAGVTIGRNAVVGANAVVRDDVPDHAVVIGDPARVVRRFTDGRWRSTRGSPGAVGPGGGVGTPSRPPRP